jgi:tetratricopeptide (TPR) repeat protein
LEPTFLVEREQPKSKIWLPNLWSVNYAETHKEVESGWSIELDEIPESGTLPELPQATVIYEETNRHWFWVTYTLVRENGEWRIQRMADEGLNAQTLSVEELQGKTDELDSYLREFSQKYTEQDIKQLEEEEAMTYLGQLATYVMQAIGYNDILIKKLPLDRSLYADAAALMVTVGQYERCLAYLVPLTQRFPEQRGLFLRRMADVQLRTSEEYFEEEYEERGELYLELAEKSLQESLAVENSLEAHLSLAEMFLDDDERFDEAKDHLLQAKELVTDPADEAHVERHLGEIAMEQDEFQKALSHYQRVVELKPDSANIWSEIGEAHEMLDHFEEAEANYKRAIELQPENASYYYKLSTLYSENDQPSQAMEVIEQGLAANPDSAALHAHMASAYLERDDYQQAEIFLNKAEQLNPDSEFIKRLRGIFDMSKPKQVYTTHRLGKPGKQGRRGR